MRLALLIGLAIGLVCSCGGSSDETVPATGGTAGAAGTGGGAGGTAGGAAGTAGSAGSTGGTAGTAGSNAGAGGVAGTGGVAGAAGSAKNSGDCETDKECGDGKCVEVIAGGFRVCLSPVQEATSCESPPDAGGNDQCCTSADCATGKCYLTPIVPFCGGVMPKPQNVCGADKCTDTSCAAGNVCMPAGAHGYKVRDCLAAVCLRDSDCTAEAGGKCEPVADPCCNSPRGFYCVYPGTGCRNSSDCKSGEYCEVQNNVPKCIPGPVGCPA